MCTFGSNWLPLTNHLYTLELSLVLLAVVHRHSLHEIFTAVGMLQVFNSHIQPEGGRGGLQAMALITQGEICGLSKP